jgi:hypothetical protein
VLLPYSMEMVVAAAAVAVDAEAVDAEAARARGARHTHCWYSFTESHDTSARSKSTPPRRFDNETTSGLP